VIGSTTIDASSLIIGDNYLSANFYGVNNKSLTFRLSVTSNTNSTASVTVSDFAADKIFVVLPVSFYDVSAKASGDKTSIRWKVGDETDVKEYSIEKSTGENIFRSIGSIPATKKNEYYYEDAEPVTGKVYYRIRSIDLDGKFQISNTVVFNSPRRSAALQAWPSPANQMVRVKHIISNSPGVIRLYNVAGSILKEEKTFPGDVENTMELVGLSRGTYLIKYAEAYGNEQVTTIIKQ
jgi:hypothetical protein